MHAPPSPVPQSLDALACPEKYWTKTGCEIVVSLATSATNGLSSDEAAARLRVVGSNSIRTAHTGGALRTLAAQFRSPLVLVLVFAAVVAAAFGEKHDAIIIGVIVLASCLLGFSQEYGAQRAVEALKRRVSLTTTVRRDGTSVILPANEIVPGDLIELSAGSLIPADAVILEAQDLNVSEASLTGETFPVSKAPGKAAPEAALSGRLNCVFTGTSVRSGTATVVAVATGNRTEFASIASAVARQIPETDFAKGIRHFGYLMTKVMLCIVLVVFVANLVLHRPLVDSLLFSLALAVGLTPELLPAIISVTLARGARIMSRAGVIVRRLEAMENLGSMDVLCTDKTGTLTTGVIDLDRCVTADGKDSQAVAHLGWLNATMQSGMRNPLDDAVKQSLAERNFPSSYRKCGEIPYDFLRKRLSVIVEGPDCPRRLIAKGAVSNILEVCTHAVSSTGKTIALDEAMRADIDTRYRDWGTAGLRVIAVATKELASDRISKEDETGLKLEGFLLFIDPPKPDAAVALSSLSARGIKTKVISGDNRFVVAHLARTIGLGCDRVLTGSDIAAMSNDALFARATKTDLFVEIDPNQKERIIAALRKSGHVVGYMGDGINDAPALHADVGISVDSAVDVAREAADIVLLQRDLSVLARGVDDGRRTFANTLKYISIATSANFGNMASMAAASMALPFLPLLAKQILLNNLLSDIPSMAIATDNVDSTTLRRPQQWDIARIQRFMLWFGPLSSVFDILTFVFLLAVAAAGAEQFRSGWFVESLITQLSTMLVVRTPGPFWKSRPGPLLLSATIAVAILGTALPYLPFAGVFGFVPIPGSILAGLFGISLAFVVSLEAVKRVYFRKQPQGRRKKSRALARSRQASALDPDQG
ncbi:magnesium-translocating P-type ATPase [Rhizobium sp. BK376]|uniref:magnesium-translocating P-type ATPase n=1 Tax=Rhizobium sp. BK376 TaxID=2512149 RepID=UPI001044971E|nr:magnesium-translocating P-type ATPase [Rhizobium sp. BK376]TCR75598.1 Mg2+-importing ATPase [Rhizobium sp. BK376]